MLFYVDWCPHCKTAKPEWNKMKDKYEGKTINGYKVNFTEYNCTKESPEIDNLLDQYKIEGYPTIKLVKDGQVLLDLAGEIQAEYRRHLHPSGAPGVGDRFYQEVLRSSPLIVERVYLPRRPDGEYVDVPQTVIECGFDPSDRKFVALAHRENVPVFISTDTDYVEHQVVLSASGIQVSYLCGCDPARWFE